MVSQLTEAMIVNGVVLAIAISVRTFRNYAKNV